MRYSLYRTGFRLRDHYAFKGYQFVHYLQLPGSFTGSVWPEWPEWRDRMVCAVVHGARLTRLIQRFVTGLSMAATMRSFHRSLSHFPKELVRALLPAVD